VDLHTEQWRSALERFAEKNLNENIFAFVIQNQDAPSENVSTKSDLTVL
jgi:hypothetical protein